MTATKRAYALLDALSEAVVAVERDTTIGYWNATAERLYGWSAPEVVGGPASQIFGSTAASYGGR